MRCDPADHEVLHVIPQEFVIDGQEGVKEPLGMSGVRLVVRVHIVSGAVSAVQNVTNACVAADWEISRSCCSRFCFGLCGADRGRKGLGVCLIDIGGGDRCRDFRWRLDPLYGSDSGRWGSDHNDIAMALRTPTAEAETIKLQHGVALRPGLIRSK